MSSGEDGHIAAVVSLGGTDVADAAVVLEDAAFGRAKLCTG